MYCARLKNVHDLALKSIHETAIGFMTKVEQEYGSEMIEEWNKIHKTVNVNIKKTIESLENEFRALLGAS